MEVGGEGSCPYPSEPENSCGAELCHLCPWACRVQPTAWHREGCPWMLGKEGKKAAFGLVCSRQHGKTERRQRGKPVKEKAEPQPWQGKVKFSCVLGAWIFLAISNPHQKQLALPSGLQPSFGHSRASPVLGPGLCYVWLLLLHFLLWGTGTQCPLLFFRQRSP